MISLFMMRVSQKHFISVLNSLDDRDRVLYFNIIEANKAQGLRVEDPMVEYGLLASKSSEFLSGIIGQIQSLWDCYFGSGDAGKVDVRDPQTLL
jgi:hypothetical protein